MSRGTRVVILRIVAVAVVLVQLVALATLAYLVDLSIALMELWAELARKHLELTL